MDIKSFKPIFDEICINYIDQKISQSTQLLANNKLNSFVEYIKDFVASGGKRIRPYCAWIVYK
ncbi:TPA: hypothetical protein DEP21_04615 [Patescibacteria group bacterium]|nr:hypothetical protein [Candidatus Gracilibacteria bacterium]